MHDDKKHFYFSPLLNKFGWTENFIEDINNPKSIKKEKFCCFVVKNTTLGNGAKIRIQFFKELCNYKKVDSFGASLRNCDVIIPHRNKGWDKNYLNEIGKYKFMITFENIYNNGVVTEKIYNAFKANTVTIYWGNKEIYKVFNKGSFINCHDFENFNKVIEYVKSVDNDDKLYRKILNKKS